MSAQMAWRPVRSADCGEAAARGRILRDERLDERQRAGVGAGVGGDAEPAAVVEQADPGHAEPAGRHRDAAGGGQHRVLILLAHDRFADAAEHRVDAIELADARLGLPAVGHVLRRAARLERGAGVVAKNGGAQVHDAHLAAGPRSRGSRAA